MLRIPFNHVFLSMLLISGICTFFVPPRYTNHARGWIDCTLLPVADPLRRMAAAIRGRVTASPADPAGPSGDSAREEVPQLQATIARLTLQLAELQRLQRERDLLGEIEPYCVVASVIGADSSGRDSLIVSSADSGQISPGMAVLCRNVVVGQVSAVRPGGAQLRLVSDRGFQVNAAFGRVRGAEFVPLATKPPLLEGRGAGRMAITNLSLKELSDLRAGDMVLLDDADGWPALLKGCLLGRVESIRPLARNSLFAEVMVRPPFNPLQLREVMIVTLKPAQQAPIPRLTPDRARASEAGPVPAARRPRN